MAPDYYDILPILEVSAKHTPAPFLMVKKDFFLWKKKNESLILASVYIAP